MRASILAIVLTAHTGAVFAQTDDRAATQRGPGVRAPYITSTGATVDKPGEPQSSGNTRMDRQIQQKDNRIDSSLCKGC